MHFVGNILKMRTELDKPVRYFLSNGNEEIFMNELIGSDVKIAYKNQINCIKCGRQITKSYAQGYCFPCFQNAPETEECVLRPELCNAHKGIARDMEFAKNHCLINHFVYLSYTSNLKVGVTRNTQIPTRWIDQGAIAAIKIAETPNRYIAGLIEVALKSRFADKTNYRKMLIKKDIDLDLLNEKLHAIGFLSDNLRQYSIIDNTITTIEYPIQFLPDKLVSINLEKEIYIIDRLVAIKGQYLIFHSGKIINIRNYAGYLIDFNV